MFFVTNHYLKAAP